MTPAWGPSRTSYQCDHSFSASENAPESPSFAHLIDISVHLSPPHHILFWGYKKEKTRPLSSGTQDLVGAQGSLHACLLTPYPHSSPTPMSGNETRRFESSWKNCWVGLLTTILAENPVEPEMMRIRSNRGSFRWSSMQHPLGERGNTLGSSWGTSHVACVRIKWNNCVKLEECPAEVEAQHLLTVIICYTESFLILPIKMVHLELTPQSGFTFHFLPLKRQSLALLPAERLDSM